MGSSYLCHSGNLHPSEPHDYPISDLNPRSGWPILVGMTGEPKREEIILEEALVEQPPEEQLLQRRLVVIEGTKYPNTDAIPTQPLRCIRDR